jgi:hypothetical protein
MTQYPQHLDLANIPNNLSATEYRELANGSAIHPDLIALNFFHFEGNLALERLLISDKLSRRNTGVLSYKHLKRYRHVEEGGWWCNGVDVLNNFEDDYWGQFKPSNPIASADCGKLIKYEAPPKYPTGIFALKVSDRIWRKIARRYKIKLYNSPASQRLLDRRSPLSFWEWVLKHPEIPIIITEGSKKAAALLSAGYVAIALPGVFNGYRTPKDSWGNKIGKSSLIPQLRVFTQPGREIYFAFDSDNKASTLKNVNTAILTTGKLFEQLECKVKVIQWLPELGKGADDLIVNQGTAAFDFIYNSALPLEIWQTKIATRLTYSANIRLFQRYLNLKKHLKQHLDLNNQQFEQLLDPENELITSEYSDLKDFNLRTIPVTKTRRCFLEEFNVEEIEDEDVDHLSQDVGEEISPEDREKHEKIIPDSAKLICIKSPKGTGKTHLLEQQVYSALSAGQWVLVLSHRVQLAEALCVRFGLPYLTEIRACETGAILGYGLCVDSLHGHSSARFKAENWHDGIVIIDEAEQVLWHLLNSKTCFKERVAILKSLQTLIQNTLSGDGKVYIADADLSDIAIDYVRSLAGFHVEPFVIINDWKPTERERWTVNLYEDTNPSRLVAALVKQIEDGGKPMICCSAQKPKSKWGTQNLAAYLKQIFPYKRILVIDSETVADPDHPAYGCIAHLNDVLPSYDIVLASPAVETGVSIECTHLLPTNAQIPLAFLSLQLGLYLPIDKTRTRSHFSSVWTIAQGVQPSDSIRQSMARVRANVPRHLWAAKRGFTGSMVGNGATSYKSLLLSQHKLAKANMRLLVTADAISEFDNVELNFQPESLKTWATRGAVINLGMQNYRTSIVNGLIEEGHQIIPAVIEANNSPQEAATVKKEITEVAQSNYTTECSEISLSRDLTDAEHKKLKDKRAKTKQERRMERKGDLARRYGVEVTPELVAADDRGWYSQLLTHYYLTVGKTYLFNRDRHKLKELANSGENSIWLPDFNRSLLSSSIRMLELLGVHRLLIDDGQVSDSDPLLVGMASLAKANQWEIKTALNVTIKDTDSPVAIAQKLLGLLGLKLDYVGRFGSRGDRERIYAYHDPDDDREAVFDVWTSREQAYLENSRQTSTDNLVSRGSNKRYITPSLDTEEENIECRDRKQKENPLEEEKEFKTFPSGSFVQWAGRTGRWIVNYCTGIVASIRDNLGREHLVDCREIKLEE